MRCDGNEEGGPHGRKAGKGEVSGRAGEGGASAGRMNADSDEAGGPQVKTAMPPGRRHSQAMAVAGHGNAGPGHADAGVAIAVAAWGHREGKEEERGRGRGSLQLQGSRDGASQEPARVSAQGGADARA